jgi:hypothetical protein
MGCGDGRNHGSHSSVEMNWEHYPAKGLTNELKTRLSLKSEKRDYASNTVIAYVN